MDGQIIHKLEITTHQGTFMGQLILFRESLLQFVQPGIRTHLEGILIGWSDPPLLSSLDCEDSFASWLGSIAKASGRSVNKVDRICGMCPIALALGQACPEVRQMRRSPS